MLSVAKAATLVVTSTIANLLLRHPQNMAVITNVLLLLLLLHLLGAFIVLVTVAIGIVTTTPTSPNPTTTNSTTTTVASSALVLVVAAAAAAADTVAAVGFSLQFFSRTISCQLSATGHGTHTTFGRQVPAAKLPPRTQHFLPVPA